MSRWKLELGLFDLLLLLLFPFELFTIWSLAEHARAIGQIALDWSMHGRFAVAMQ